MTIAHTNTFKTQLFSRLFTTIKYNNSQQLFDIACI